MLGQVNKGRGWRIGRERINIVPRLQHRFIADAMVTFYPVLVYIPYMLQEMTNPYVVITWSCFLETRRNI